MRQNTFKRLSGSLALVFLSTVISIAAAEWAVRTFAPQSTEPHARGLFEKDSQLQFVPRPNVSGVHASPEYRVEITINSLGLRNVELRPGENSGRRILVLGDSFTFGWGVQDAEAFPAQVQDLLRKAGFPDIDVINAGVTGYGTVQEAGWFERIQPHVQADAVLLAFFVGNDFYDNLQLSGYEIVDGYLVDRPFGAAPRLTERLGIPPYVRVLVRTRSHLYNLLMNGWDAVLLRFGLQETTATYEIYESRTTETARRAFDITENALRKLHSLCQRWQVPFGIVIIPDGPAIDHLKQVPGYDLAKPGNRIRDVSASQGIPVLDLTPIFRAQPQLYFPMDAHWTPEGHRLGARLIADSLREGALKSLLLSPRTFGGERKGSQAD